MSRTIFFCGLLSVCLGACHAQPSEHVTNKIFNEGVALNLQSIDAQNAGKQELARQLNRQSLEKFQEVLRVDPGNPAVRSCLGHCYYIDRQFDSAIVWFEQSNRLDKEMAANYREIGLCHVNKGQIKEGKDAIDKAFSMDTTREIRTLTLQNLEDIANVAGAWAESYDKEGKKEEALEYRKFTIGVLELFLEYDQTQGEIYDAIISLATAIGDKETADQFRKEKQTAPLEKQHP